MEANVCFGKGVCDKMLLLLRTLLEGVLHKMELSLCIADWAVFLSYKERTSGVFFLRMLFGRHGIIHTSVCMEYGQEYHFCIHTVKACAIHLLQSKGTGSQERAPSHSIPDQKNI